MLLDIKRSISKIITLSAVASLTSLATASGVDGYATRNGGTTGGAGGKVVYASTGTEINEAICNRSSESTPIIIKVSGTINHGNTSRRSGSCDTESDEIQFKRVSNISLIGQGNGAVFDQIGIHLREAENIIIRNIRIRNVKKSGSPTSNGGDAIGMEKNVRNVWIDHNTIEASGGEKNGYDGLLDMKNNTKYVTVSYNKFYHSGRGGLVGSSDSDSNNSYITFHHNWYDKIDSRIPLLRHGTAHAYNNYYTNVSKSAMNPRAGGRIKAENNHFSNVKNPLGTFYTDKRGYWQATGNIFENVSWSEEDDDTYPAGGNGSTTTISVPYSYQLDAARCVASIVKSAAGAGKNFKVSDGSCSTTGGDDGGNDDGDNGDDDGDNGNDDGDNGNDDGDNGNDDGDSGSNGNNLSIGAKSDGSSKGTGSYGSFRDGDTATYWAPKSSDSSKRISIKWSSNTTINTVVIVEANGYKGNIGNWQLVNHNTGAVIKSGNGAGRITFDDVSLKKLSFYIESSSGTPTIAEFETYNN